LTVGSSAKPVFWEPQPAPRVREQAIGVKLRQMFDQVVNEPIPQEFLDILRRGDESLSGADEE